MNIKKDGAFKTISEVASELNIQQHVLRFWEKKFSVIKPMTRGGGRRYYRPEDIVLLKSIQNLLYSEMYTISGVQRLLKENGKAYVINKYTDDIQEAVSEDSKNNHDIAVNSYRRDLFDGQDLTDKNTKDLNQFISNSILELEAMRNILRAQ
ncbi:MAG: MerR family transcriptional regulator [Hyphomicrobiales bacterium]